MPALDISVDGVKIATVNMDGLDVVSLNVSGTQVDEDVASLDVSGGSYPENGQPTSLTWVGCFPLHAGQRINVVFLESAASSHPGKTVEELFPDEPVSTQTDFTLTAEMFRELRAKPKHRENFSFRLSLSSGTSFVGTTATNEHGFGFTVLWNSFHPERARVSLHSYTLENLETHSPMNNLVEENIQYGSSVDFQLVA
jgi:hypothetical protein